MIKLIVDFGDGVISEYVGTQFQHGARALVLTTDNDSYIAIPESKVKAYEVQRVQTEKEKDQTKEPDVWRDEVERDMETESDPKQEESSFEEEEA